MDQQVLRRVLTLVVVGAVSALLPAMTTLAQSPGGSAQISIDAPLANASASNGTPVDVGGWATDSTGPGTGVDAVRVYLDGPMDGNGTLLGMATYGEPRADVAAAQGSPVFTNSGFDYAWTPSGLSSGQHTLYVYAHSVVNGWVSKSVAITASTPPGTQSSVTIADFAFRPGTTTVHVGDTIAWTNNGPSTHTATSDSGLWDTGQLGVGQSGSFTFTSAGTYNYHCTIHASMRGTVTVLAPGATAASTTDGASGYSGGSGGYQSGPGTGPMNGFQSYPGGPGPMGGYGYGPMGGYGSGPMGYPSPGNMPYGPIMGPPMMSPPPMMFR